MKSNTNMPVSNLALVSQTPPLLLRRLHKFVLTFGFVQKGRVSIGIGGAPFLDKPSRSRTMILRKW